MNNTAINLTRVFKTFKSGFRKKQPVLKDMSLTVHQGEVYGFLGPNGAGKSTTIKLLMNFIRPDSGRITINGIDVATGHFQRHVGYLPEGPFFYENLSATETLQFAGRGYDLPTSDIKEKGSAILERLNLSLAAHKRIHTYSKGMKQRLGLAAALLHDPDIYILDEPMSGLDPIGRKLIIDVILELREKGKTVFFSTHILSDVEKLCDRLGLIDRGELLYAGTKEGIYEHGDTLDDAFMNLIAAHQGTQ